MDGEAGGDETGGGETFDALLVDAGLEDVWVREGAGTATTPPAVLERVAGAASPAVATLLLSVASNRYLALGDSGAARAAAERAVAADPMSTRSVAALADAVEPGPDRRVLAALEHAIALVGPRARWCAALADTLDALGEAGLAVRWTQRCVELRPGDQAARSTPCSSGWSGRAIRLDWATRSRGCCRNRSPSPGWRGRSRRRSAPSA